MLLVQEEVYWKQRAKAFWLRDGDSNTKYFHAVATSRKRKNLITKLRNNNDVLVENHQELCKVAKDYFLDLF